MNKDLRNFVFSTVFLWVLLVWGCAGTLNVGGESGSWQADIVNWTPHQKAAFFMQTWLAQKADYDMMNAMADKPKLIVDTLNAKRQLLEQSRLPIRAYATAVNSGQGIDAAAEQEIVRWITNLQLLAISYSQNGGLE